MPLLKNPRILEINAWTWLNALSDKHGRRITLNDVPPEELRGEISYFDAVWLMGVWERSLESRRVALNHPGLQEEFRKALPDFAYRDVVGSPYSVRDYRVAERLGGPQGLAALRTQLAAQGASLILDFVPNHVAVDHEWTTRKPHFLMRGFREDLSSQPGQFFAVAGHVYAHGRDPYFPPWTDTVQIDAFHPEARRELTRIVKGLAEQCDGVRCDMAMLVTNEVFSRTWGQRAGAPPAEEFWEGLIGSVKNDYPAFVFIAEAYWDTEWQLQQQGFDYCYDKRLYDRLAHEGADAVRAHLSADLSYQEKLLRFIENHDEPRAPTVFGERSGAAAILALTLPGAKLVHEGQMAGHRIKLPVQLGRRPVEADDPAVAELYDRILRFTSGSAFRKGEWRLCPIEGQSGHDCIAYLWAAEAICSLIVVNFSEKPAQGRVLLDGFSFGGTWRFQEFLTHTSRIYEKGELDARGVEVELDPWQGCLFECARLE